MVTFMRLEERSCITFSAVERISSGMKYVSVSNARQMLATLLAAGWKIEQSVIRLDFVVESNALVLTKLRRH